MRKGIAVDGTFLSSRYNGVLLAAVAQDAENHIFPIIFCVADKECEAFYGVFLNNYDAASKIPKSCILYRIGIQVFQRWVHFFSFQLTLVVALGIFERTFETTITTKGSLPFFI